jgi:pimeloyl-ACP methyl ester carboxylesterase
LEHREILPHITCPLLAIQGKDDEYGTPAQAESIAGKVMGPARGSMIDNCGHIPHIQAREKVFSEMVSFIRELIRR